jgi:hypothetical protein
MLTMMSNEMLWFHHLHANNALIIMIYAFPKWILLCFLQYFTFSYKHGAGPPDKVISYS